MSTTDPTSTPGRPAYGALLDADVAVPARDGTVLSTDIFHPAIDGIAVTGRFPVLLCRTPYTKERYHAEAEHLAGHGYVVAVQDWRQTHGEMDVSQFRSRHEPTDGYDAVEWLAVQPWSNGKVGAWGHSAMGQAIQAMLPLSPPSLASVFIIDSGLNYGSYPARQNGTFGLALRFRYALQMALQLERDPVRKRMFEEAYRDPTKYFALLTRPHAPITAGTTILAQSPASEEKYLRAAMTDDLDDPFWKDGGRPDEELIDEWKDIPTCFVSGWYANHLTANFDKFRALSGRFESPVELVVGHWEHRMTPTFAGTVEFGAESDIDVFGVQRVHWFDRTLKDIDADVEAPAVRYFLMGGGKGTRNADGRLVHGGRWAGSQTWPPAEASTVAYHLHGDGALHERAPDVAGSSTTFTFDPRDPVPTVGGAFMEYSRHDFFARVTWMADGGAQDQRGNPSKPFCRDGLPLAQRDDVLVFQTEPLDEDVVIAGEIVARLWVSSDALDTDFTVKLIDVHPPTAGFPEGFAMNLQDAVVRMRYRNGRRKPDMIEPGAVYEIELPMHSTANRFVAGHRIRVDVSSSNFPRIDVNLNNGGPLGVPGPVRTAENTVFHDKNRPSRIELSVIPG